VLVPAGHDWSALWIPVPPPTFVPPSGNLPDPRVERARRHALLDIITIPVCAVICGADTWVDVARVGVAKRTGFGTFLALPNGIPSHDPFGRVFAALNPDAFETTVLGWVRGLVTTTDGGCGK